MGNKLDSAVFIVEKSFRHETYDPYRGLISPNTMLVGMKSHKLNMCISKSTLIPILM